MSAANLGLLLHHLYEYRKGVRQLFMMTVTAPEAEVARRRLDDEGIACHLHWVGPHKANVFFGRAPCVEIVRHMVVKPLRRLTPEEDFILGSLLGYDREQQCRRYLARTRGGGPECLDHPAA